MTKFSEHKLIRIIISRWKKHQENILVEKKREVCSKCEYNSLNVEFIPKRKSLLIKLSAFYSFICGKSDLDILGNCLACESCSVYYKTEDEEHCPHPTGDKWKSIYIPNSAQKIKKEKK